MIDKKRALYLINQGLSSTEIARVFGVSRGAITRRFPEETFYRHSPARDYRMIIEGMDKDDAIELLIIMLECQREQPSFCEDLSDTITGSERVIVNCLRARAGKVVPKTTLYEKLYHDRLHEREFPDSKIIDVFICKLRRKIAPHKIDTIRAFGYRWMEAEQ